MAKNNLVEKGSAIIRLLVFLSFFSFLIASLLLLFVLFCFFLLFSLLNIVISEMEEVETSLQLLANCLPSKRFDIEVVGFRGEYNERHDGVRAA